MPRLSKSYLLLRWKDGWQEVLGVDESSVELLRYYVLERVEEVGRLALETKADYPILLTIKRMSKQLDSLVIIGGDSQKFYSFKPVARREEGGKIEHVEYDKAERHFQYEGETDVETKIERILDSLRVKLNKMGLTVENLLAMEPAQRLETYKQLARGLGIRAAERQEDVCGFIQLMIEKLAGNKFRRSRKLR
jgi:hypothetical protein